MNPELGALIVGMLLRIANRWYVARELVELLSGPMQLEITGSVVVGRMKFEVRLPPPQVHC